jgi:hypothetical protein
MVEEPPPDLATLQCKHVAADPAFDKWEKNNSNSGDMLNKYSFYLDSLI